MPYSVRKNMESQRFCINVYFHKQSIEKLCVGVITVFLEVF